MSREGPFVRRIALVGPNIPHRDTGHTGRSAIHATASERAAVTGDHRYRLVGILDVHVDRERRGWCWRS